MRVMVIAGMLFSITLSDLVIADQNENMRAPRPDALSYPGSTPEIVSPFDSAELEQVQQCVCQLKTIIESGFDVVASQLDLVIEIDETILSKMSQIDSEVDVVESKIDELSACASTPITTAGTISLPGTYCFANNITGNIIINSSDVILDLNGFRLTGNISITQPSVTIRNGEIDGNGGEGISVDTGFGSIAIQDMIITNCSYGIHSFFFLMPPASGLVISDVFVDNGGSGVSGCQIENRPDVVISNSVFAGSVYGLYLGLDNSLAPASGCKDVEITNCQFNNNSNSGYFDQSSLVFAANENIRISNSFANQNGIYGFSVASFGGTLIDCQATNNGTAGFNIGPANLNPANPVDIICLRCLAVNHDYGFFVSTGCKIEIQECLAFDNNINGFLVNVNINTANSTVGTISLCSAINNGICGFTDISTSAVKYVSNFASFRPLSYSLNGPPYTPISVTASTATYWRNVYL